MNVFADEWLSSGAYIMQTGYLQTPERLLRFRNLASLLVGCARTHNNASHDPMYHTSTPRTFHFLPSSLSGSFPNVGHVSLTPLLRLSSSHSP